MRSYLNKFIKFIMDKKFRFNVLSLLGFYNSMEDRKYLKIKYKIEMGRKLNIENPRTFNEKIQWLKINDHKEIYTTMVDKFKAKSYVEKKIGKQYIVPTYGVWDRFEDIDFDILPNQFVLKCTHDSGGLVIVRDKLNFDKKKAKKKIEKSLRNNYYYSCREWPYKNVKPRIIAEKYLKDTQMNKSGLVDFKIFCFNGKAKFLYISQGLENHLTAKISFYDLEFNKMPFKRSDYEGFISDPPKPKNIKKMIQIAEKLAINIPFLRVDLYEVDEQIYFSELTFSPCSGMIPFEPQEWDLKLGDLLELPNKN